MKNKIFLSIVAFIVIFFGVSFAILNFFQKFKFKTKENDKDFDDEKKINSKDDFKDQIIGENSKEWESFNF